MNDNSNISQELLEAIERYIDGTMEPDELKDFNDYLKIDAHFKAEVEDIKMMFVGIKTQSLKEQLDSFHKDIPETKEAAARKALFLNYRRLTAAAAIIIGIGFIWFFSSLPNEKLYNSYFKPDRGLPTTVESRTNNFDFYEAMVNYKQGDYPSAIKKWQLLNEKKPNNDTINYFLGVAHLANKNEDKAIPFLEKAILNDQFSYQDNAFYYLGLSYLKNGNYKAAKKNLKLSNLETSKNVLENLE